MFLKIMNTNKPISVWKHFSRIFYNTECYKMLVTVLSTFSKNSRPSHVYPENSENPLVVPITFFLDSSGVPSRGEVRRNEVPLLFFYFYHPLFPIPHVLNHFDRWICSNPKRIMVSSALSRWNNFWVCPTT